MQSELEGGFVYNRERRKNCPMESNYECDSLVY